MKEMSQGTRFLALALIAIHNGEKDACLHYMSQAAEFGDDLTQFVDEVRRIGNTATRNDLSTSESENSLAPSLKIAVASTKVDFTQAVREISRQVALASYIDEGDELVEQQAIAFDAEDEDELDSIGPVGYV